MDTFVTDTMDDTANIPENDLASDALALLMQVLTADDGKRVVRVVLPGATGSAAPNDASEGVFWVKRFGIERVRLVQRAHAALSPLIPVAALRSAALADPAAQLEREQRKLEAFASAGIPVPRIVLKGDRALVFSDTGADVQKRLRALVEAGETELAEELILRIASSLGAVHAAGLCHGRPHPRDMFVAGNGRIGFYDFEEEPEARMPLADAQARDVWLLFMQICADPPKPETPERALAAYRAAAPLGVLPRVGPIIAPVKPFLPLVGLFKHRGLGKDGKRFLNATRFLSDALQHGAGKGSEEAPARPELRGASTMNKAGKG
ncbi:serine/threonine protein phosphatase [Pseudohoeflea suaedae]|uniref:Serine/threonine protein phosphatase n=1 Tax=Pseudohoeflea suaedae TaxID=877384 RepID=A0A4R5PM97_9HYPH|nr:serine/threonine protein phosphatase [Pseudohoeflea suaedae]TDH37978.1 serine/threonine protein phosphatase [Pseudohoeflea suaedae]